jgi:hypothetical protein
VPVPPPLTRREGSDRAATGEPPFDQWVQRPWALVGQCVELVQGEERDHVDDAGADVGCAALVGASEALRDGPDEEAVGRRREVGELPGQPEEKGQRNQSFGGGGQVGKGGAFMLLRKTVPLTGGDLLSCGSRAPPVA